jgi:hypothetical protein
VGNLDLALVNDASDTLLTVCLLDNTGAGGAIAGADNPLVWEYIAETGNHVQSVQLCHALVRTNHLVKLTLQTVKGNATSDYDWADFGSVDDAFKNDV